VKCDDSGVLGAIVGAPGYPLVRVLFGDSGVELPPHTGDADDPMGMGVTYLVNRVDPLHEVGIRLELRPLVVSGRHVNINVDRFCDGAQIWVSYSKMLERT